MNYKIVPLPPAKEAWTNNKSNSSADDQGSHSGLSAGFKAQEANSDSDQSPWTTDPSGDIIIEMGNGEVGRFNKWNILPPHVWAQIVFYIFNLKHNTLVTEDNYVIREEPFKRNLTFIRLLILAKNFPALREALQEKSYYLPFKNQLHHHYLFPRKAKILSWHTHRILDMLDRITNHCHTLKNRKTIKYQLKRSLNNGLFFTFLSPLVGGLAAGATPLFLSLLTAQQALRAYHLLKRCGTDKVKTPYHPANLGRGWSGVFASSTPLFLALNVYLEIVFGLPIVEEIGIASYLIERSLSPGMVGALLACLDALLFACFPNIMGLNLTTPGIQEDTIFLPPSCQLIFDLKRIDSEAGLLELHDDEMVIIFPDNITLEEKLANTEALLTRLENCLTPATTVRSRASLFYFEEHFDDKHEETSIEAPFL